MIFDFRVIVDGENENVPEEIKKREMLMRSKYFRIVLVNHRISIATTTAAPMAAATKTTTVSTFGVRKGGTHSYNKSMTTTIPGKFATTLVENNLATMTATMVITITAPIPCIIL